MAAAESIAGVHFAGATSSFSMPPGGADTERRRQANRDKRAARKRRAQDQREELQKLKGQRRMEPSEPQGKKGSGKGKSKDQAGLQLCFSWSSRTGPCAEVAPGGECKCVVKRVHKCQFCLSPSHRNDECPGK